MLTEELGSLRTILVTGKGGVGKTTVAAAVARTLAKSGRRVLCAELSKEGDVASPLGDALGAPQLGDDPVAVAENLSACAIFAAAGQQKFLRDVLPMRMLADAAMKSAAIRRFLLSAPTFAEMGVLYRLLDLVRARRRDGTFEHDVLVVDLPATGHALALAQIPESILGVVSSGPVADAVRDGLAFLRDPAMVGTLVVTLPETLPVSESLELVQALEPHRIRVVGLVVNRMPFDPFEPEERACLTRLVEGRPQLLGMRSVDRIDRARAAVARLRSATSVRIREVGEVTQAGPKVVEAMASMLGGEAIT